MIINKKLNSEMTSFIDKKSGREVIKLTETGTNWHFYFTENSFTAGEKEIYYWHTDANLSDTGAAKNIFKVNIETGERTQVTQFEKHFKTVGSATKSRDSKYLVFTGDGNMYSLNLETGENRLICKAIEGYQLEQPSLSFDNKYVAFTANIKLPDYAAEMMKGKDGHQNYFGFKERMYAIKSSYLIIARMDGSGAEIVFQDTHWMGHVQFAPDTNEYITFCHEGPWNYVHQRIWMFNTVTRTVKPCFEQKEEDSVGHEFWTRDGLVFYDNRGPGHDGTITSDKTQAVTMDAEGKDAIPQVGFVDKNCNIVRTLELPYYCNHYHANTPNTLLAADAVEDIVLIDISEDKPKIEVLCEHNTSWRWQAVHCHPTWSWDDEYILFASDCDNEGAPQLYVVKM